jgi:hypothetical protein
MTIMVTTMMIMVVEAKRVAVPVDILCWRLMAPKSGFAVGHCALP